MRIRDLLKMEIDVDVYDDVCEELGIAFCGPCKLTKKGEDTFKDILDLQVDLVEDRIYGGYECAVVNVDDEEGIWQKKLKLAKLLFNGFAGYISDERWNELFEEV